ncbi:MAG: CRTAC1 family protein [Alphaproteobacteria bacterium]|nr:CRTAC1 family protein [Alphaproteobacteria bacterium]
MRLAAGLALFAAVSPAIAGEAPRAVPNAPHFVEEATAAGVAHVYDGAWEHFVGGGAAAFDCNGDRKPDLALAGGKSPVRLLVNHSQAGGALRFDEGDMGLSDKDRIGALGIYPLDIDDDGHLDLVLLRVGRNLLLKGGPNCAFEKASRAWAFDGGRAWTTAFAATWEPDAAFPTLAFGNYVDRTAPGSPWGTCDDNLLLRPSSGGTPRYDQSTALTPGHCALSMLFTDWNRSGEPALRIANDRQYHLNGEEQLWRIPPKRAPRLYSRSDGWARLKIWGMAIAEADLDADGYPEYALTSMGDTKLQRLDEEAEEGRPVYRDIAFEKGATAHRPYTGGDRRPSTGWHAEFADFDNDGLLDLFIAKGNVEAMPDFSAYDPDNLLLGQPDGGFLEAGDTAGIALDRRGRGGAIADFNLDGMLDLAVVNRGDPVSLFRNLGNRAAHGRRPLGNWLAIELRQPSPNRNAVGARVSVRVGNRTLTRIVQVGGGHASGRAGWVHLGLGTAERAQIRVQWPDGEWSHAFRAFANNFVIIDRAEAEVRYWYPD